MAGIIVHGLSSRQSCPPPATTTTGIVALSCSSSELQPLQPGLCHPRMCTCPNEPQSLTRLSRDASLFSARIETQTDSCSCPFALSPGRSARSPPGAEVTDRVVFSKTLGLTVTLCIMLGRMSANRGKRTVSDRRVHRRPVYALCSWFSTMRQPTMLSLAFVLRPCKPVSRLQDACPALLEEVGKTISKEHIDPARPHALKQSNPHQGYTVATQSQGNHDQFHGTLLFAVPPVS